MALGSPQGGGGPHDQPLSGFILLPQACRLQKLFGADGDLADEVRDRTVTAPGTPPGPSTTSMP